MNTTFRVLRQMYKYNMNQSAVAASLGLSNDALRARLQREGTCFAALLKRVRRRMLMQLLDHGKSADCISYELGYDSNTTFFWAFRKLMGISWTEYHRRKVA